MAIQVRRGLKADFDPNKLRAGEPASPLDTKELYVAFAPGDVKRIATFEDFQAQIDTLQAQLNSMIEATARANSSAEYIENLTVDKIGINDATATLTEAYSSIKTEELFNDAKNYSNDLFASVTSFKVLIVDILPTEDIQTLTIYLVPKVASDNDNYDEYMYINDAWEHIGSTSVDLAELENKIDKTSIVQTTVTNDTTKVPSSAVTYGLQQEIITNTNNIANINSNLANVGGMNVYAVCSVGTGYVATSMIPLYMASTRTLTIHSINVTGVGDLTSAELALLNTIKTSIGFAITTADGALSAKLSGTFLVISLGIA